MNKIVPSVLTVAGSDSGGGAGIQTDLRTFNKFNVYGCSVITAVTSQNPDEVRRVDVMPVDSVRTQMETVLDVMPVRFAKTGMLAGSGIIEAIADAAVKYTLPLIVDPVMVSTSGAVLLENSAISAMTAKLFPAAKWITPNIPEAELICAKKIHSFADLTGIAMNLYKTFGCNVLLKGGHAAGNGFATDIVCYQGELFALSSPVAEVKKNTAHGTGCTLSAALTANFALGKTWQKALICAKTFVYGSLCESVNLNSTLSQMYPPAKDYSKLIKMEKL